MIKNAPYTREELSSLSKQQLDALAEEIRRLIISSVKANGGHLSSNLGAVEATIALYRTFDFPSDSLIFDVGHQCYAHKILSGRGGEFFSLRQEGGISGFPCREESAYDKFTTGHAGNSVSLASGLAEAARLSKKDYYTVVFAGDGALTNGELFEGLNNCRGKNLKLIIVINDNGMSISESVGGVKSHLTAMRTSARYFKLKNGLKRFFGKIPLIGKGLYAMARAGKNFLKRNLVKGNIFSDLGLDYIGPVDGNDVIKVCTVLEEAKKSDRCCVVHIVTRKGFGDEKAEADPDIYHSVSTESNGGTTFSAVFGEYMAGKAAADEKVCAVTAAMRDGTGLKEFSLHFPERFFDVGIAEEHAVSFSAGLSMGGYKPVVAMYSTFAQRAYDQLSEDVALNGADVILALDRCGIVEGDGATHQGIFDYALLSSIPGVTVFSPETYGELRDCMEKSFLLKGLKAVRYPKGSEAAYDRSEFIPYGDFTYTPDTLTAEKVVITYGRITERVFSALKGKGIGIIKLIKIYPINYGAILSLASSVKKFFTVEEEYSGGNVAEKLSSGLNIPVESICIHDFVPHGGEEELFKKCGLTAENIDKRITIG